MYDFLLCECVDKKISESGIITEGICRSKAYGQSSRARVHTFGQSLRHYCTYSLKMHLHDPDFNSQYRGNWMSYGPQTKTKTNRYGSFPWVPLDLLIWWRNEAVSVVSVTGSFFCTMKMVLRDATERRTLLFFFIQKSCKV